MGEEHWYRSAEEMLQHFHLQRDNVKSRTAFLSGDMF